MDQVKGVSDEDRELAWANIKKAAKYYGLDIEEKSWRELGKHPHTKNPRAFKKQIAFQDQVRNT